MVVILFLFFSLVDGIVERVFARVKESEHLLDILRYDCNDVWVYEMARTRQ